MLDKLLNCLIHYDFFYVAIQGIKEYFLATKTDLLIYCMSSLMPKLKHFLPSAKFKLFLQVLSTMADVHRYTFFLHIRTFIHKTFL